MGFILVVETLCEVMGEIMKRLIAIWHCENGHEWEWADDQTPEEKICPECGTWVTGIHAGRWEKEDKMGKSPYGSGVPLPEELLPESDFDGWASVSNEALIMIALYRIMKKLFTESYEATYIIEELKKRFEKDWDEKMIELKLVQQKSQIERQAGEAD